MKIAFVGLKENSINFFPELSKALSKRISGLELEERFAPFPEDLPIIAKEVAEDADFIFVYAMIEDESLIDMLKEKLIDVEISTKTRILKAVDADEVSGLDEEEYYAKKEELVIHYADLIVRILFNEEEFEPKDKDFAL
jgi:hypothetical protein